MDRHKRAQLQHIAAELDRLHRAAKAAGEPFLAYLIEMARVEAEKPGG